jgi:UBX domain-containing protein 1/4
MPSGNRLEIKLTKQDVLRKVKNFVDENQGNGLDSYDLSLVYPKRVFSEQGTESLFLVEIIYIYISLYFFILKFLI